MHVCSFVFGGGALGGLARTGRGAVVFAFCASRVLQVRAASACCVRGVARSRVDLWHGVTCQCCRTIRACVWRLVSRARALRDYSTR